MAVPLDQVKNAAQAPPPRADTPTIARGVSTADVTRGFSLESHDSAAEQAAEQDVGKDSDRNYHELEVNACKLRSLTCNS